MLDLILRSCRLATGAEPVDLAIADGRIVSVGRADEAARETVDVAGRVVTPGLVEAHIHLDKALLVDRVSGSAETAADGSGKISRCGSAKPLLGGSTRFGGGAASIASSNGEDSIAAPLSEGRLATGVCHWKASSRPVTGDTGRQRSLT